MILPSVLLIVVTLATFIYCLQRLHTLPAQESPIGWIAAATFCLLVGAFFTAGLPLALIATMGWFTTFFIAFLILLGLGLASSRGYRVYQKSRYPY